MIIYRGYWMWTRCGSGGWWFFEILEYTPGTPTSVGKMIHRSSQDRKWWLREHQAEDEGKKWVDTYHERSEHEDGKANQARVG